MPTETTEEYRSYSRYHIDLSKFYQKKQLRVYTGIVLSILTVTFFLAFAIRPTFLTIAGLVREIGNQKEVAEKLESKIKALSSAQIKYQQIQKNLYLVDEALPSETNPSLLMRQLEALARKDGVVVNSIKFERTVLKGEQANGGAIKSSAKAQNEFPGVYFGINMTGDFDQLKSFLNDLTQLRRLVLIEDFSFGSDSEGELILNLSGKACYLTSSQGSSQEVDRQEAESKKL